MYSYKGSRDIIIKYLFHNSYRIDLLEIRNCLPCKHFVVLHCINFPSLWIRKIAIGFLYVNSYATSLTKDEKTLIDQCFIIDFVTFSCAGMYSLINSNSGPSFIQPNIILHKAIFLDDASSGMLGIFNTLYMKEYLPLQRFFWFWITVKMQ